MMGGRWGGLVGISWMVLAFSTGVRAQACEPAAASVISVQGDVDVSDSGRAHWRDVQLNQVLCAGQQLRLMAKSRAVLRLPNETLVHLDEGSVLTLQPVAPEKPAWLDLLRGALHIISRVPRALNIRTPFVNAGTEGTEFALRVDPAQAELWVYEGRVRFSNTLGQLLIASGEAAAAAPGRAPERRIVVKPRQAVEWALYYPPLLDTRPERYPEALRPAVLAYRQNDLPAAFAALDGVPEGARDGRYHTLRAGLLLSVGRVPEAEGDLRSAEQLDPKEGTALALRSVIAVVRNEQEEALKLAAEAVRLAPGSATPYVARSYAEQSTFEIETARESLKKAAELAPEDALVWARLAELELSLGDLDAALEAATKAETLDPGLSRTKTVLGFAYLTRIEIDEARAAFERALVLDPADPLPRLGLGLAKIREGDLDAGTKEIEIAASLDPNNSLVRSYLGKAYHEQKRGGLAETEFEQAKLLDPKDPTPWFYDAIQKQTTNRPVEALRDLEKAIELNDNRAVYRSKLLLDEDLATRGAALGRIYQELGFQQRGLVEAWKSLREDPSDYTAHRLLSDSYSILPRHEIARISEFLQSQLMQPISITPVQPQLAESDLFLLGDTGPAEPSLNEFNPLFQRNRFGLLASGLVGTRNTYSDEVVQSGIWNNLSFSLGQLHYETDGFRSNNDVQVDVYNAFVQGRISPKLNVQAEFRHRDVENGNLESFFSPTESDRISLRNSREESDSDTYRLGLHVSPSTRSDLLVSFIYLDENAASIFAGFPPTSATSEGYLSETQYLYRGEILNTIFGGGYYRLNQAIEDQRSRTEHGNTYLYSQIEFPSSVAYTLGLSVDIFDSDFFEKTRNRINPKFGVFWNITADTVFRAAFFKVLKRSLVANQTIEPTQIAGFNQFFDDLNGTRSERWGAGIDHRFTPVFTGGVEASARDLRIPIAGPASIELRWEESLYRAYLQFTPHPRWAAIIEYLREDFDNLESFGPLDTETQIIPFSVSYFDPSGLFTKLRVSYLDQDVVLDTGSDSDSATFLDLSLGYRLPKRWGIFEVQLQNALDQDYRYEGLRDRRPREVAGLPSFLPFPPNLTVFARVTLAF